MTAVPRVVLLPGLACDANMWRDQLATIPARYAAMVSDVHSRFDSIEAMAAALLVETSGELVLVGASMGGIVAMEVARQSPARVRAMALLGTNASPETPEMRALREAAIELFAQGRLAEVIEPNVAFAFHPDNAPALRAIATLRAATPSSNARSSVNLPARGRSLNGRARPATAAGAAR